MFFIVKGHKDGGK